ncbi:MAG: helix-turn-helix domain-containing protein [Saprospiraceae bacterium]
MIYLPYLLFSIGFTAAISAIILSLYLVFSGKEWNHSSKLFGVFLFLISLRILKSLLYAYSVEEPILVLQSGPLFFLLIGPALIHYVLAVKGKEENILFKYRKQHSFFWVGIVVCLTILFPFPRHVEFTKTILLNMVNLQWLLYILLSFLVVLSPVKKFDFSKKNIWLSGLLMGALVIWLECYFISFEYFVIPSISYSAILFGSAVLLLRFNSDFVTIFKTSKSATQPNAEDELKIEKVKSIMTNQLLFKRTDLKLKDVASHTGISQHELSRIINANLTLNFNDFVNQYRIEEAKKMLDEDHNYTIEGISQEVGFKSKSAFYNAFKKFVGVSPSQFKGKTSPE